MQMASKYEIDHLARRRGGQSSAQVPFGNWGRCPNEPGAPTSSHTVPVAHFKRPSRRVEIGKTAGRRLERIPWLALKLGLDQIGQDCLEIQFNVLFVTGFNGSTSVVAGNGYSMYVAEPLVEK